MNGPSVVQKYHTLVGDARNVGHCRPDVNGTQPAYNLCMEDNDLKGRLNAINARFSGVDARLEKIDVHVLKLDARFLEIERLILEEGKRIRRYVDAIDDRQLTLDD
jgi:hypothetical protein